MREGVLAAQIIARTKLWRRKRHARWKESVDLQKTAWPRRRCKPVACQTPDVSFSKRALAIA